MTSGGPTPPAARSATLRAGDGTRLHYHVWSAPSPRAALLLSHGLGEHGGRYAPIAAALVADGVSVFALDHRGHGRSGGQRGHIARFSRFTADFEAFRAAVVAGLPPKLPAFVLGHSLGGLIVLRWLQAHPAAPVRGTILSAPLLGVAIQAPRVKLALAGTLSRFLPRLPIRSEIDASDLSSDVAYVRSYRDDPLVHSRITPRLYTEMMAAIDFALADPVTPNPALFLIPGVDRVVDERAVAAYAARLPGDVEVRHYPELRHEPLNDTARAVVVADVQAWIRGKLP